MADEEESGCKVEYLDTPDGSVEETNWIKRAGKARVTYPNGSTFTGMMTLCTDIFQFLVYCFNFFRNL